MAKAKPKGRPKAGPGEKIDSPIQVWGTASFKRWALDFARSQRLGITDLIRKALRRLAKEEGYEEPPEK